MLRRISMLLLVSLMAACSSTAPTAELPRPATMPGRVMLPQEHQYQRQLRAYMATLTEKDFDHGVTDGMKIAATNPSPEYQYRNYLFNLIGGGVPLVGSKRGVPAINNPPARFLLSSIEMPATADKPSAIGRPLVYPEALMQVTLWDYPGNVYYNNRALKMRCFVNATIALIMLDDFLDQNAIPQARRADWRAYQLIIIGSPYDGFKDLLPPEVRRAFQDGLMKLARRLMSYGPRGEEDNLDFILPIGLWYASRVCDDPAFTKEVEDFARMMFTDPRFTHPAGYWVERGGLDTGFAGQTNFFAVWAALASDWPFAREAVEKVYRLRAHLTLPEPDGTLTGPASFNTRLNSPPNSDQWYFGGRDAAALMLTDEAAPCVKSPEPQALADAAKSRSGEIGRQIAENPIKSGNGSAATPYVYYKNEELGMYTWRANIFENWQFPASMNFAYEFYRKGSFAHLTSLEKKQSPMLKFPFARGETFLRNFANAFVVARMPEYGVVLHTGPVGRQDPDNGLVKLPTALGFGGGQLSAFWTPATGSVILGRRGGMVHQNPHDKLEEWRTWPIHAVSGVTAEGKVFTSGRIATPQTDVKTTSAGGRATVRGQLTAMKIVTDPASTPEKPIKPMYDEPMAGRLDYARTFDIDSGKLHIDTKVTFTGQDKITELYETIPVYHRDGRLQPQAQPTAIEFQVAGQWKPATPEYQEQVTAVKLTRFAGAVQITFDKPVRIKLSPVEWKDAIQLSFASCRNLMIDLMPAAPAPAPGGAAGSFKEAAVGYSIAAVKK